MTTEDDYDLAIIGSGSAGFAAAIAARRRGLAVVMVESGTVGGTCVNTGCVPSKALLAAAETRSAASTSRFPGAPTSAAPVSWPAVRRAKDDIVGELRAGKYTELASAHGWEILAGTAGFTGTPGDPGVDVSLNDGGTRRISASHYLVATGATPWTPEIPGLTETGYLTSATAMELERLPRSLIVIGGNSVGLEQAQLFARLGVKVSIVETMDRVAPFEEPEVSSVLEHAFAAEGIEVHACHTPRSVTFGRDGEYTVEVVDHHGETYRLRAEQLLMATGRRPDTAGLGLAEVGVARGGTGEIIVDATLRTGNPRIWAAGDVTGHPQYVYVAGRHGTMVVGNAFEQANDTVDYDALPRVTFTSPAIAAVGLTEARTIAVGYECRTRVLPMEHVPRAIVDRDAAGLIKVVAESTTGRLLGVHIASDNAGEVIQAATLALRQCMTVAELAAEWGPYLTMAEGLKLAAQAFTTDVAALSCCAT